MKRKLIAAVVLLLALASTSYAEDIYDLQHIYDLTDALEFNHWAEELIPASPSQGVLLYKIIMLTITIPLFAILLLWEVISELQSFNAINAGKIDYMDIAKRILIFIVFIGFGNVIYGYMSSLQRGMHSLIEIVGSQDSEFFLQAFYKEDAGNQNRLTRAINAGKEDALGRLLNTAKEPVKYKDDDRGAIMSVLRAHYMALPLAAYNEALLLYSGSKSVSLPYGESLRTYKNPDPYIDAYPSLIRTDDSRQNLHARSLLAYASILQDFPSYPTVYSKAERNARENLNEQIKDIIPADSPQVEDGQVPVISYASTPKPPSGAKLADYLLDTISKSGDPNVAVAKFVKSQILYMMEYDPAIRQGINRIIWNLYNRKSDELDNLSIAEAESKIEEAKLASSPAEAAKYTLPPDFESLAKERVSQLIIDQITILGALRPVVVDGKVLTPSEYCTGITQSPTWFQRLWDWGTSKLERLQENCSISSGFFGRLVNLPHIIMDTIVGWLNTFMIYLQKIIVYIMAVFMSYILALQFFFASITCCFVANYRTQNIFYTNFRICLHVALIPFMCMLLLTIFNVAMNNMWAALIPPPNGIVNGLMDIGAAGALMYMQAGGIAASGYALQVAFVIIVFQIAGMVFLAIYSIKATGILIRGGGLGGAALALMGAAMVAGKVAAGGYASALARAPKSSVSPDAKAGGLGGIPPAPRDGGDLGGSSGNNGSPGHPNRKTVPQNNMPKPVETASDKKTTPGASAHSHSKKAPAASTSSRESPTTKPPSYHAPTAANNVSEERQDPTPTPASRLSSISNGVKGHYQKQKKLYNKIGPRMGAFLKGSGKAIWESVSSGASGMDRNNFDI